VQDYLGDTAGYPLGHDLDAMATFTGTIRARFADDTLYDDARAGTELAMSLLWSKSATRLLQIDVPHVHLDPVGVPVSGPGRFEMSFNFRANQTSADPMVTVTLKNGHDASEYA
jgi:hypothetical protein